MESYKLVNINLLENLISSLTNKELPTELILEYNVHTLLSKSKRVFNRLNSYLD